MVNLTSEDFDDGGIRLDILDRVCQGDTSTILDLCFFATYGLTDQVLRNPRAMKVLRARVIACRFRESTNAVLWERILNQMTWSWTPEGHGFWEHIYHRGYATPAEVRTINQRTREAMTRLYREMEVNEEPVEPPSSLKPRLSEFPGCCAGTVVNRIGFGDPDRINPGMTWENLVEYHGRDLKTMGRAFQVIVLHKKQIDSLAEKGHRIEELGYKPTTDWLPNRRGEKCLKMFVRVPQ